MEKIYMFLIALIVILFILDVSKIYRYVCEYTYMEKIYKFLMVLIVILFILNTSKIYSRVCEYNEAERLRVINSSTYVDKSLVLDYIDFVGDISEDTVREFVDIVETQVPQAAFNFLVNSGGRIYLVEGNDVSDYSEGEFSFPEDWLLSGFASFEYANGLKGQYLATSSSVVLAADMIDYSTRHEFMHVFDSCVGFESQSDAFRQIYQDIDSYHVFSVSMQDYSQDYTAFDFYFLSAEHECFAEIMSRYISGEISDERLQGYCQRVLESI